MQNYDKVNTYSYGTIKYTLNGKLHRIDGPAVIWSNGDQVWYKNGLLHNDNGPAIIYANWDKEYYKFGIQLSSPDDNPIFLTNDNQYSLYYLNGKFMQVVGNLQNKKQFIIGHIPYQIIKKEQNYF